MSKPAKTGRKDLNQIAKSIVDFATGEIEPEQELSGKKADSRKGGLKGGRARMSRMTKEQRSELAKKAAEARWSNTAPATKASAVKPKSAKQR